MTCIEGATWMRTAVGQYHGPSDPHRYDELCDLTPRCIPVDMTGLDSFTRGYLVALLWSETGTDTTGEQVSFDDAGFDEGDILPEGMAEIRTDCESFFVTYSELWEGLCNHSQAGHDFALTRNHHGAGFWDRGYGPIGEQLTKACDPYGEQSLFATDSGKIEVTS